MTASAIHMLLEKNIELHFLGYYGQFKGRLMSRFSKNFLLQSEVPLARLGDCNTKSVTNR